LRNTHLGKIDFHYSPVGIAQAAKVAHFPLHHSDPFDRLLIAQILLLPAQLITADFGAPALFGIGAARLSKGLPGFPFQCMDTDLPMQVC